MIQSLHVPTVEINGMVVADAVPTLAPTVKSHMSLTEEIEEDHASLAGATWADVFGATVIQRSASSIGRTLTRGQNSI